MTTGEKIAKLRKENNYTQEQLAQLLGVSRQSISKYESDMAYPETDKLIRLGEIFDCSLDYLLKDDITEPISNERLHENTEEVVEQAVRNIFRKMRNFEKKSNKMVCGLPLWHIGRKAKGIIAIGISAKGIISIGFFASGVLSIGICSIGVLAIGVLAFGLLALGSIAAGGIACGGVSAGLLAFGGVAAGCFAIGGFATGQYLALGDIAEGMHAIGKTDAAGTCFEHLGELSEVDKALLVQSLYKETPGFFHWIIKIVEAVI